ncbi:MAG: MATE family efflux transporter [Gammaproteobacteria bacterium]|nr:MATE family efflux transporter [Gammaproteobacteria bacterium]
MIVSQGAYALMIFTDRYFMSMISPTHLAASLGGGIAAFFSLSLFVGVLSYTNALVANAYGADKFGNCSKVLTQSVIMIALSIPFLILITYLVGFMFAGMGHDPLQVELEYLYFNVLMLGALITLLKVCFGSYFSGIGRTRNVMIADGSGVLLNIPVSYILIFGKLGFPELGILGAGIGTIIGSLFTLLIMLYYYFEREHRELFRVLESFAYNQRLMLRHLRFGFPSGMEMFLNVAAFNLFLLMFQSYGVAEGASAAIVFNWDIVSFVPMIGLHIGIISLIGRYTGANQMDRADDVIRSAFFVGLSYSAALGVLFAVFREPLVGMFITTGIDSPEIRELASYMMIGLSTYVMADAIILIAGGVLRGAGDTRWLMIASVILHWLMLVVQFFVIKVWLLTPLVSWLVLVLLILAIAAVYLWRLKSNKWRNPEVFAQLLAD